MSFPDQIKSLLLSGQTLSDTLVLDIFRYQYEHNKVYKSFCTHIRVFPQEVDTPLKIPHLPIQFFKTHEVLSTQVKPNIYFQSSGTTGQVPSRHYVADPDFYKSISTLLFETRLGPLTDYVFLALLPSYQERPNSSLIFMVNHFMQASGHPASQYVVPGSNSISKILQQIKPDGRKICIIGVSYALLDAHITEPLPADTVLIETGGMKGRRKEMSKAELHDTLKTKFRLSTIYGEYGMTELLSQSYGIDAVYRLPHSMRISIRETSDPLTVSVSKGRGVINIMDFANIDSCCFIATDDLARLHSTNSFEILGRADNAEARGCNMMI